MPAKLQGPCRGKPACPNRAIARGLCASCARAHDANRGSAAERGYGRQWQRLRARVLAEEPFCRLGCGQLAVEVDHIIPKPIGGDERENLQGLCRHHHSAKTMRQSVAISAGNGDIARRF